jgi:(p)ppGpp synthase/HD superfamily hydrolase
MRTGIKPVNMVFKAVNIASEAHKNQFRRDGVTPYILHPKLVATLVDGDPEAKAVAWLHDVLEDTTETETSLLEQGIPETIVDVVVLLTKVDGMDYFEYLKKIKENPLARKVKIADMLANLSDRPTQKQVFKYLAGLQFLFG